MTRYGYDLAGRAVMLIGGNGQVTENTYDVAGRLVNRVLFRSLMEREQDDVMAEFGWAHDAVGNVVAQHEVWPGSVDRAAGVRATTMTYDGANRLETETITDPEQGVIATSYAYDAANNRDTKTVTGGSDPGFWDYSYNDANQLTAWEKRSALAGTLMKSATLGYDDNGNRTSQTVTEVATTTTSVTAYHWDAQDRLSAVVMPDASVHSYDYDYRTRRTGTSRSGGSLPPTRTTIVFAGGLSLAEWETENSEPITANSPSVEYTRGPDMGGGVGGLLYSARAESGTGLQPVSLKYNLSNGRGDIVAQSDNSGALTWTASYEAYGKRTKETGVNADKQRANSKDEDPTGLLNEGFRYRDIETGVWLSRDPAGFVDGPNLYAYVMQNPWSKFDADGLFWSAIVTAGFAAYDTYQYATGQMSGAEYAGAMALNGAALLADVATGGMGGGLAVRAANATIKVAKAVDKADTLYSTANGAIRTAEAIASGDGTGAVINGVLTAVGAKQMGGGGKAPDAPKVDAPGGKSAQTTNVEAQQVTDASVPQSNLSPTNYPNPDPPMSAPPVRYEPKTVEEVVRMRQGENPIPRQADGSHIEMHHRQQVPIGNGGVMDELNGRIHRMDGNHTRHSRPSQLTPSQRRKEIIEHNKQRGAEYLLPAEGI